MIDPQRTVDELCDQYRALVRALNPASSTGDNGGSSHAKPGSRPPLRLEVSHQRREIDETIEDIALRTREHLGFQHYKPQTTTHLETGWLMNAQACTVTTVEVIDYATILTLRALPALLDALPEAMAGAYLEDLDVLRKTTRVTLGLDAPLMKLAAVCPECFGLERIPLTLRPLVADVEQARVWCTNPACGYACGNSSCWCAAPGGRRHRMVWTRYDLLRLGQLLETG